MWFTGCGRALGSVTGSDTYIATVTALALSLDATTEDVQMGKTKAFTVSINMEFTDEFVRGLFENYPEAGRGACLQCTNWQYGDNGKPFRMTFHDDEEDKDYNLDLAGAVKGFKVFVAKHMRGELAGISISDYKDAGDYDADALDCITQCALLGDVVYG